MSDQKLTLKEMCAKYEVTPRTLRHYEYIELIFPEKIGRSRFYGPKEEARLKLILRGKRFGFPLEGVRQWLLLYDADPMNRLQTETWIEMSGRQLDRLAAQRKDLDETIEELRRLRDASVESLKSMD
jgi:DNA-binding transcriptional MerR regulator